jgi:hypothetical protein
MKQKNPYRKPRKLLPTKSERQVLNWLKCRTSHLDLGCLFNGSPIHLNTNERVQQHFANLRAYQDEDCPVPKKNRRTYLPNKLVTRVLREHTSGEQTYYFAGSEKPNCRALIMIDVDCHKSGSPEGARAFVSYLRAHHFGNLYYERSTNGRGAHAYFLLEKDGLSVPAVKNVLLKKLQPWLNHLAKGFDVELVEVKGLPPDAVWGERKYDLTSYKAGVLAKLPRGVFDRFAELQETTVLSAKTLAMELPDVLPEPSAEKKKTVAGSSSMKHIDCSKLNVYRRIAKELLKGEILTTSGRHVVLEVDVAIFLLLGSWLSRHMNADGSMPWARFKGFWNSVYAAGDIERPFEAKRFAAIRNQFEAWGLLEWENVHYRQGAAAKWCFSKYLLDVIDEYLEQESHPCQAQGSPEIKIETDPFKIIRRPTLVRPYLIEMYDPVWRIDAEQQLMALCA